MGNKKNKFSKQKNTKPDGYYNDGLFEIMRFGRITVSRNLATPEEHVQILMKLKAEYHQIVKRINEKVSVLRGKISEINPLQVFPFINSMAMLVNLNKFSESDYTNQDNITNRAREYVQSVLVSTESIYNKKEEGPEVEKRLHSLLKDIEELHGELNLFYNCWAVNQESNGDKTWDELQYIVESQMLYLVRGNRYQVFELQPLKKLLPLHSDILGELYGVTSNQIIDGLEKLKYSLSQGLADAFIDLRQCVDDLAGDNDLEMDADAKKIVTSVKSKQIFEKAFGVGLNNVLLVTGWDIRLIDALSLNIGECGDFFDDSEFSGWPIIELPIKKKPFIKIDGISYAFDYYTVFDNFYRALQKAIFEQKPEYIELWNFRQKVASEEMVESLFFNMLPGAKAYSSNYYPIGSSLKKMAENDLLIMYDKYLFVIEIKAGSFPHTPPFIDFDAHIKAYKNLIEKADSQCTRTVKYINDHQTAYFYTEAKQKKFEITNLSEIEEVFLFSVTIDDFNDFATKAEKLSFLTMSSKTIVISYNDLMVYEKYFESPAYFLHFLKQRKAAIGVPQISLFDELDHLGMYIKHNIYSITANEFSEADRVHWHGYRQDLDYYFCKLAHPSLNSTKPKQALLSEIRDIIELIENRKQKNWIQLIHFFLDFSTEAEENFCKSVQYAKLRQNEIGKMVVSRFFGETKYCLFVETPGIKVLSAEEREDFVYSAILCDVTKPIMWIDLEYDNGEKLVNVAGKLRSYSDIPASEIDRLNALSIEFKKRMIENFRSQNRKIGRNDPCPCGSGKKYKKCCIVYK